MPVFPLNPALHLSPVGPDFVVAGQLPGPDAGAVDHQVEAPLGGHPSQVRYLPRPGRQHQATAQGPGKLEFEINLRFTKVLLHLPELLEHDREELDRLDGVRDELGTVPKKKCGKMSYYSILSYLCKFGS